MIASVTNLKLFLGTLSVLISIPAYAIYIRETIKKDGIQPHPFSWLLWGFVTTIAALAQHAEDGGPGLWVTAFTAVICFLIGILTLSKNDWHFSKSDWTALIVGTIAALLYAFQRNATAAAVLATIADVIAYKPTVTKGWIDPSTETPTSFLLNSMKFIPALAALNSYSIATSLYPATLVVVNGAVWLMLLFRHRQLGRSQERNYN